MIKLIRCLNIFKVGKNGNEFTYKKPITQEVVLKNYERIDYFLIEGYVKPQYWSDAKQFVRTFKRQINFNEGFR